MNALLAINLSDNMRLVVVSSKTLENIQCCDGIDIKVYHENNQYVVCEKLVARELSLLRKVLTYMLLKQEQQPVSLWNFLQINWTSQGLRLGICYKDSIWKHWIVSFDLIQAWISQIELLLVVMEENENELKNKGKGCC